MASLIQGITVLLYEPTQTGTDSFNHPVYTEQPVAVENVLVCPVGADDLTSEIQLHGKRAEYELCIPKGDTHDWQDKRVEFFGQMWRTFGFPLKWIEENVPLDWNTKIKVERYG